MLDTLVKIVKIIPVENGGRDGIRTNQLKETQADRVERRMEDFT